MSAPYQYDRPLGADICTGGPGYRAWVSGMHMHREFKDWERMQLWPLDLHTEHGCEILDWPIDAPEYLPAGSTKMDWFPRTTHFHRGA